MKCNREVTRISLQRPCVYTRVTERRGGGGGGGGLLALVAFHPFVISSFISKTRGLEALTRMLFFKFPVNIIGFCVKSEVH